MKARSRAAAAKPTSRGTPPVGPSNGSTACSGCGISPNDVPGLVADAGDAAAGRSGPPGRVAEHDLPGRLELGEEVGVAANQLPSPCLTGIASSLPLREQRAVNGVSVLLDRQRDVAADELERRFERSTPGSRPASQRIWKPLQTPSTRPPAPAKAGDGAHHRRERAIAPQRR